MCLLCPASHPPPFGIPHCGVWDHRPQNPHHCTRPPSPPKRGDVTAQKELFRQRVKGITVEASKSFHLPFILFHTGLHKSFSARVVSIPQAPMRASYGCCATGLGPLGDVITRPEPSRLPSSLRASYGCYATGLGPWDSASVPVRAFYLGSPLIPCIMSLPVPLSVLRSPSFVLRPSASESVRPSLIMPRGGLPRAVCCCRPHSVGWY